MKPTQSAANAPARAPLRSLASRRPLAKSKNVRVRLHPRAKIAISQERFGKIPTSTGIMSRTAR
eukprot:478597-Pleurochrysis_carterae.AAC.1